jgi:hypothetical protein
VTRTGVAVDGVGLGETDGVGLGETDGVGLGETDGVGLGETDGVGLGETDGVGLGETEAEGLGEGVVVPASLVTNASSGPALAAWNGACVGKLSEPVEPTT